MNAERKRLREAREGTPWKLWGPYLSERQWGTVREDYSPGGDAWDHFTHDAARSRAYRWGEDGIAGISDDQQRLCFCLALWNGRDPILKERLFGLTGNEGNHGEDVKELYYYLDSTPTHSYMKMLYKYPQAEFPYARLVEENARRGYTDPEFELLDTGIFDDDRYFDVFVEVAKAGVRDLLIRVTAHNRGPQPAALHLLPQIWFRNTWSWGPDRPRPRLSADGSAVAALHPDLGDLRLCADGSPELLFCDNETNARRLFGQDAPGYFKDAFHERVVHGSRAAVNPRRTGTKAAAWYAREIEPGGEISLRLRLTPEELERPFATFDGTFSRRRSEADAFYAELQEGVAGDDARLVQRQALAGMLWSKQFYYFDVAEWLEGDESPPPPPEARRRGRNAGWEHLNNADVLSMPDKWEYPWYAAWDLAFHCIPLAMVDPDFAKQQLVLLTREWYMHPNGQLPAYEWSFGDVNPPVHAWATWRVYKIDRKKKGGKGDLEFLERVFHKLLLNFTWWVNRKDEHDNNLFQGGFLGLDNIGVFDRSSELPTGGHIEQADGTSWMAMFSLNLLRMALELAESNPVYQDVATKFFEHFLYIAFALSNIGEDDHDLWDDDDAFYYDYLHISGEGAGGEQHIPLKVRSMVGLIPLFAVETLEEDLLARFPEFEERMSWFLAHRPKLARMVSSWETPGEGERHLLSLLDEERLTSILRRMLDETEFLSDYGVRALSRHHLEHPYVFWTGGVAHTVTYRPAESDSGLFGGNSNWRGPIWLPVNFLIIESLQKFHHYYGDRLTVECPAGSGTRLTIDEVADELSRRLCRIFLRGDDGRRPVFGRDEKLQRDPQFRDYVLFYEYFHGDNGRGVGAAHQTGWTGAVAKLLQPRAKSG